MAAKGLFLGVIFLCELAALAAYGYWGFKLPAPLLVKGAVMLGLPIAVAVVWGLFLAPKAEYPVPAGVRLLMKTLVFGFAAAALVATGKPRLAAIFSACVVVAHAMDYALESVDGRRDG
ncbi:YrdB family protein [Paenibacillus aurantiacus]|uniref:YrdB family protein n=1 Tax=Paenibacillus aurantiacus TaxID=1936118 RepID=A0ABV5KNA4_9BACL